MNRRILLIIMIAVILFVLFWVLAAVLIPNIIKTGAKAKAVVCIANLQKIERAKEIWAFETDAVMAEVPVTPTWPDLVGIYIEEMPVCPSGGTYTIGRYGEPPTCSIGNNNTASTADDHTLQ